MKISAQLNGLEKALTKLGTLPVEIHAAEVLGITRVAAMLRDSMVQYVGEGHPDHPEVQTGRLKSSLRYVVDPGTPVKATVGSDASYAAYVEFGHAQEPGRFVPKLGKRLVASSVKPYPFVRPALTDVIDGGSGLTMFTKTLKEQLKI